MLLVVLNFLEATGYNGEKSSVSSLLPAAVHLTFLVLNSDGISHVSGVPESLPGLTACDSNLDIDCPLILNLLFKKNFFLSLVFSY